MEAVDELGPSSAHTSEASAPSSTLAYQKLGVDWKRANLTLSLGLLPSIWGRLFVCGYLLSQAWEDAKMN